MKRCLIFTLFLLPVFCLSQTAEEIALQTEAKIRSYRSLQADFEHIYHSSTVSTPLEENGRLYIKKPDWMKWEYKEPEKKMFLYRDDLFQSYFPEDNQLVRQSLSEEDSEAETLSLLTGQKSLLDQYEVEFDSFPTENKKVWQLRLTPNDENEDAFLLLEIDQSTGLISKLISLDWSGNRQEFHFKNIKTNLNLADKVFELVIPPDAEIVEDIRG